MKLPKGIIAVHGYRKQFTLEEQCEIAIALHPLIEAIQAEINKWNETHELFLNEFSELKEREITL